MDKLTPDVGFTPSGEMEAWSDKLIMGEKRSGRKFSGSTGVGTWVKFTGLLVRYLVSMRLACMPRLLRRGI